jgi:hypothetical protein
MEHLPVEVMTVWAAAVAMGAWAWTLGAGVAEVKVVILWVSLLGLVAVAAKEAVRVLEMRVAGAEAEMTRVGRLRWLERQVARMAAEVEAWRRRLQRLVRRLRRWRRG